jgi:hypothetical protein
MMLSPWDAPRYLWAAIEGAGGLDVNGKDAKINPSLAADWRWLTAVNVPFRGTSIAWIAIRMPDGLEVLTTSGLGSDAHLTAFSQDVSDTVRVADPLATLVAFAVEDRITIFIGNSGAQAVTTAASLISLPDRDYTVRLFSTVWNDWQDRGKVRATDIHDGIVVVIDAGGFALVELTPEASFAK